MLGQVVRKVVLRYVRSLINLQVEKLELWSGAITLESVSLNPIEATKALNLPGIRLISGSIGRLELAIPWTNLLEEPVIVSISALALHLLVLDSPAAGSAHAPSSEDSLLLTVLSNLHISLEDLTVTVEFEGKNRYFARIEVGKIGVLPVNSAGEVGFRDPVVGTGIEVIRQASIENMHLRVVAGPAGAYLSLEVIAHLREKKECRACGLCQAFKLSGFYTILHMKQWSADITLGHESNSAQTSHWAEVKTTFPVNIRANLIAQTDISADIVRLYSCLYPAQASAPSLCILSLSLPRVAFIVKTYNPTTLQIGYFDLQCEQLTTRLLSGSEISLEGSVQSFALAINPHIVCFQLSAVRYGLTVMTRMLFSSASLTVLFGTETTLSVPNMTGELLLNEREVRLKTSLSTLAMDMGLSAMMALLAALNDLRLFYLRFWLDHSLLPRADSLFTQSQRTNQSWTLDSLREEMVSLTYRSLAATAETERLRSVLTHILPLYSLQDLLSLEEDNIVAVSPEALYEGEACKAVLTATQFLLLSQHGSTLFRIPIKEIASVEAINTQGLLLHFHSAPDLTLTLACRDQFLARLHTIS